jgi:galactose oxidase
VLAEEAVDRCYHATAVLLPDGRVLSAGGGEYAPTNNVANPANDTHVDAQLFSPPYLFRGPRPTFSGAPDELFYAESFELHVAQADAIAKVTWIRLGSVTHSFFGVRPGETRAGASPSPESSSGRAAAR